MRGCVFACVVFVLVTAVGCDETTDEKEQKQQELLQEEASRQVGMPAVVNFTEKKNLRWIYELCDRERLVTYTYTVDMDGQLHYLCESIGYGVPYSAQFSNPEKVVRIMAESRLTIPQAEPNGLFKPTSSAATWVIIATPNGPHAIYVEPEIVVSPVKLKAVNDEPLLVLETAAEVTGQL